MPQNQNPKQKLLEQSLRYLGVRPRSSHEIIQYLKHKSVDSNLHKAVLSELETLNLINDSEFASWFIRSRLNHKPRGPRLIAFELKSKYGLDAALIEQSLSQISPQHWTQAALSCLHKRRSRLRSFAPVKQKYIAKNILYHKGFPEEIIALAIDEHSLSE